MSKTLALDLGSAKTGIAISDENNDFSFAKEIYYGKMDESLIRHINEIIDKEKVDTIVVGVPYDVGNLLSDFGHRAVEFIKFMRSKFNVQIVEWNETMTSAQARENTKGIKRKHVDAEAARIILEEYLLLTKNHGL